MGKKFEELERNNELRPFVLQLEDEMELAERTLKGISKSVHQLIQKGAKSQPNNLMKLIEKSTSGFQGVEEFHSINHDVASNIIYQHCWGLPVVTLTAIAVSLPKIEKKEVDSLLESVREGLVYVTVVERGLNVTDGHVSSQKASETLWQEIKLNRKWLGNELQRPASLENTARQSVEWFRDKAKDMAYTQETSKRGPHDDPINNRSICANSMYRITEGILLTRLITNIDSIVSQKELFDSLSSMIADIMAACLTNLPQVIIMKCHTSVIEEREASVEGAARLLGETRRIIEALQDHDITSIHPSDMPFIDKWCAYGNP